MTDELKINQRKSRGARAEQLLQDEFFKETLEKIEQDYIAAWRRSDPKDIDGREVLYSAISVVADIINHIKSIAADGRMAQKELENLEKLRQPNVA